MRVGFEPTTLRAASKALQQQLNPKWQRAALENEPTKKNQEKMFRSKFNPSPRVFRFRFWFRVSFGRKKISGNKSVVINLKLGVPSQPSI